MLERGKVGGGGGGGWGAGGWLFHMFEQKSSYCVLIKVQKRPQLPGQASVALLVRPEVP